MTKQSFLKQFSDSKKFMQMDEAADYIHSLLKNLPMLPKGGPMHHQAYIQRLARRTACMELEEAMRNAPPWKDWRVVFAEFEWPYMRRAVNHSMNKAYEGSYGCKLKEADAWIVEMWCAYHYIFQSMPGAIPSITSWKIYNCLMDQIYNDMTKCRRRL